MNKNQKGFTAVEGLLVALILAVIGFGGYYIWNNQHKTKPVVASSTPNSTVSNFDKCQKSAGSTTLQSFPEVCVTKDGKHFTQTASTVDPYAGWQTVNAISALVKIPPSWINTTCGDGPTDVIYVSSSKSAAAVCNSGNTGEVIISASTTAPDTSFQQYSNNVNTNDVTLNNVKGKKTTYTLSSQVPGAEAGAKGNKFVEYTFNTKGMYFDALYRQDADWPDDSAVFNQIVQTWKF